MESDNGLGCALCRHKGSVCDETCEYKEILPGNRYEEFQNAEWLFGVENMMSMLGSVEASKRKECANSMFIEAEAWRRYPVHGCLGYAADLITQIQSYTYQLQSLRSVLEHCRQEGGQNQTPPPLTRYIHNCQSKPTRLT